MIQWVLYITAVSEIIISLVMMLKNYCLLGALVLSYAGTATLFCWIALPAKDTKLEEN